LKVALNNFIMHW